MKTLLFFRAFPTAVLLKLTLFAQFLVAFRTLHLVFFVEKSPINNLLAITDRTEEEILLVIEYTRIVAEPIVLAPDELATDKPDLAPGGSPFAAML